MELQRRGSSGNDFMRRVNSAMQSELKDEWSAVVISLLRCRVRTAIRLGADTVDMYSP